MTCIEAETPSTTELTVDPFNVVAVCDGTEPQLKIQLEQRRIIRTPRASAKDVAAAIVVMLMYIGTVHHQKLRLDKISRQHARVKQALVIQHQRLHLRA